MILSLPTRQTIGYYLAFTALGVALASLGPTLPALADQLNSLPGDLGFLFSARSLGYLLGSFSIGRLYDHFPGNRLIAVALLLMGVIAVFIPHTGFIWLLAVLMLVIGMGQGGLDVGGNTLLAWVYRARVAPYLNGMYFLAAAGGFITPLAIGWMLEQGYGLSGAYWLVAISMIPAAVWLAATPSPSRVSSSHQKTEKPFHWASTLPFMGLFFIYVGVEVSYAGWIYSYIVERGLGGTGIASMLTSAFWLALAMGRLLAIPISTRFTARNILAFELSLGIVSMVLILLTPANLILISIGTIGVGLALSAIFPTTFSIAERVLPITGKLAGILWASGSSGGMVIPWLVGMVLNIGDGIWMMRVLLGFMLLGAGLYGRLINLKPATQSNIIAN